MNTWTVLAQTLLNLVAEGAKLGEFLAKFNLSEETLDNLLSLDNKLKPAWALIKVRTILFLISKLTRVMFRIFLVQWNLPSRADRGESLWCEPLRFYSSVNIITINYIGSEIHHY